MKLKLSPDGSMSMLASDNVQLEGNRDVMRFSFVEPCADKWGVFVPHNRTIAHYAFRLFLYVFCRKVHTAPTRKSGIDFEIQQF
jgi:hypothetical protein